ncbi:MAG: DUF4386 domain-containing protein, partial [Anaerolineaceae bacterium]|nr:DUF4386 domain-containing protein [Anaerolineaceae bacterium]
DAPDYLASIAENGHGIILEVFFVLSMGISLALVPVVAFPIHKKINEVLALGYLVFRGALETFTYMAMAICWLLLLPLGQFYRQGNLDKTIAYALGNILYENNQVFSIGTIIFTLGALMFCYILYRSKLIPRWISVWGLAAAGLYLGTCLLGMFGLVEFNMTSDSSGAMQSILNAVSGLLAMQEMVMAVWLIVKGFNKSALAALSEKAA